MFALKESYLNVAETWDCYIETHLCSYAITRMTW